MKTKLLTLFTLLCITLSFAQTFTVNDLDYNVISTNPNEVEITGGTNIPNDLVIPEIVNDGTDNFTVTSVGDQAFRQLGLTSVNFPPTITAIGEEAFQQNQLVNLVLPQNLLSLGFRSFQGNVLVDITFPDGITVIGEATFSGNQLTSLNIPASVTSIEAVAFRNNPLTSLTLSEGLLTIGNEAFRINQLTSLTLPSTLTSVGAQAFETNNLTSVTALASIPPSVTTGTDDSFGNNRNNITLLVPSSSEQAYINAGWTGFASINNTIIAPYIEDFETFTTSSSAFTEENAWTATAGDYFWEAAPATDTGSDDTGPNPSINTGNYFYTEASDGSNGDTTDLISPLIDLTNLTAPGLTFNYHMFGSDIGTLDVLVNGADNVFTLSGEQQTSANDLWRLAEIDLSAYTNQTISVTFRGTSAGTFEGDIAIDNIIFDELSCIQPNTLDAANITDVQADLSWVEAGTATLWDIELLDITAGETATGNSTFTGLTSPSFTASGLTQDNNYAFLVRADCGVDGTSNWAGPFNFTTLISCPIPSDLTTSNITDVEADLSWVENGTAILWDIELLDLSAGDAVTGIPSVTGVTNTTFTASGLTPDNNYAFFVRADCGVDGTSNWVGPFNFLTACDVILTAPYTEDFETFTTSGNAFVAENCWRATGGSYFWESAPATDTGSDDTGPDPSITTGNYFYTEASDGSTGDITDLVSPLVDLTNLTTPTLTFNYHMFGSDIGTLDILVNGIDNLLSLSGQQQTSATAAWEFAVIDLSAYVGQTIAVTFRGTSAGQFEGDIAIDNVAFDELPSCLPPSDLAANNITDLQADLSWTENGTAALWDIELLDITAGETPTGTPTTSGLTNPSFSATGLTQDNDYDFFVRADCGGGDFSNWAGPFPFKTLETCPRPSNLSASNITDTSADLSWIENGTATLYNIELLDSTAGNTVTGTPTNSGLTTSSFAATGLTPDNDYQFFVQADCGTDGVSAWVGPFSFSTPPADPACGGLFFDTGGSSGNYSSNELYSTTILPDLAGQNVSVIFTAFNLENNGPGCFDGLTIHDGPDTNAPIINPPNGGTEWCWDRNDSTPNGSGDLQGMTITSTHPSGALTFVFRSDGSVTRSGWEATVNCATLGIDDFNNSAFTYYPNPVKSTLTLNAQQNIDAVTMYNMLGQEVLKTKPNTLNSEVDMSQLQNGTYFVKVTINNIAQTIRVIKQ